MKHTMDLNENAFLEVQSGKKTREYRLFDEKRRNLKIGDTIEFYKLPDRTESVLTIVKSLRVYQDWYSCYKDYFDEDLSMYYESIDDAVNETYDRWWPKEKEEMYGCLIIEIEIV